MMPKNSGTLGKCALCGEIAIDPILIPWSKGPDQPTHPQCVSDRLFRRTADHETEFEYADSQMKILQERAVILCAIMEQMSKRRSQKPIGTLIVQDRCLADAHWYVRNPRYLEARERYTDPAFDRLRDHWAADYHDRITLTEHVTLRTDDGHMALLVDNDGEFPPEIKNQIRLDERAYALEIQDLESRLKCIRDTLADFKKGSGP